MLFPGDLELASSKKVLEVEAKMKEFEVRFKDDAMKAFTEEVNEITNIYSNHFGKLNVAVEQLQKGLDEKNSQVNWITFCQVKIKKDVRSLKELNECVKKIIHRTFEGKFSCWGKIHP